LTAGLSLSLAAGVRKLESVNKQLAAEIAQREKAERDAEILNNHNEMILLAARDGIAGVNQSGKITFFNPAAEAATGYRASDVIAKSYHELLQCKRIDGSAYPVAESPITTTLKHGKVQQTDDEVLWRKDGTPVPVEFTSAPLIMNEEDDENGSGPDPYAQYDTSGDGKQVGAVIVFRAIDERKRSESALQQFVSIVKDSSEAIISCTLEGVITSWNRAATKFYGYTEWEMTNQYLDKLVPSENPTGFAELLTKVRENQSITSHTMTLLRKDGGQVDVVFSLSPVKNSDGIITGASMISRTVNDKVTEHSENVSSAGQSESASSLA
ncbi:MAG TPA: PAS domain S-box protein, partial [Blastocatellia bacterium]|nr:PAS domain S-box protein [Blastocatellia bacterium]